MQACTTLRSRSRHGCVYAARTCCTRSVRDLAEVQSTTERFYSFDSFSPNGHLIMILYSHCEKIGKWVIAQNEGELAYLNQMKDKAKQLGVPLDFIPRSDISKLITVRSLLPSNLSSLSSLIVHRYNRRTTRTEFECDGSASFAHDGHHRLSLANDSSRERCY